MGWPESRKVDGQMRDIKFSKRTNHHILHVNYINFTKNTINSYEYIDEIVIDIDNIEHWKSLLEEHEKEEPNTVKAYSGSGGIHLYFKYNDQLEEITSKDHCFGPDYDIDIKTNGGCIIVPPTKYFNKNLKVLEAKKSFFTFFLVEIWTIFRQAGPG